MPYKIGLPLSQMIEKCRTAYLQNAIELLKPKIIIAFGKTTANQLRHFQNQNFRIIEVNHPSRVADVDKIFIEIKRKLEQIDNPVTPTKETTSKPAESLDK